MQLCLGFSLMKMRMDMRKQSDQTAEKQKKATNGSSTQEENRAHRVGLGLVSIRSLKIVHWKWMSH